MSLRLNKWNIRFTNQPEGAKETDHFEIVRLVGKVSTNDSHLHLSISDSTGKTIAGHLLDENIIYTLLNL